MASELGVTGKAIWGAFEASQLDAGSQALVREFARCADTLDRLDDLAMGRRENWISVVFDNMGEIQLVVDKVLDLRRNHQLALRTLYAEIRAAGIKPKEAGIKHTDEEPEDMLAALRRQKEERERQSR